MVPLLIVSARPMAVAKSPEVTKASFPGIVDVEKFETLTFESSGDQCSLFGVQHSNDPIFKFFFEKWLRSFSRDAIYFLKN